MPQEHDNKQRTIRYSKEELLSLKDTHCTNDLDTSSLILPSPLRKSKRGRKRGVRVRTRRRGYKLHLPSIFLGNVQSFNNKVDELCARTTFISDYVSLKRGCNQTHQTLTWNLTGSLFIVVIELWIPENNSELVVFVCL